MKETFYGTNYVRDGKIHSKDGDFDEVRILEWDHDKNEIVVQYGDTYCTAMFNPFVGAIYVDDKYGRLEPDGHGGYKGIW